jgi:fructokinase
VSAPVIGPLLADWIGRALPGQRITGITPLAGGYRNRNTLIATSGGEAYVLRQYRAAEPPAETTAEPAGAAEPGAGRVCAVEGAQARRLRGVAPVPEVIAADPGGVAAGEPVLLSRHSPGVLLRVALTQAGGSDAAALGRVTGRALAAIGTISFPRGGLFTGPALDTSAAGMPASLPDFVAECLGAGPAHDVLSAAELAGLGALARASAPLAASAAGARQLVHSDFNPKNLLVRREPGQWSVTAVLDWEFAFSGSPLHDIGNMLRAGRAIPPAFAAGFIDGFGAGGGDLPADWREVSRALDLYALADLLTRQASHPYFGQAVSAVRDRLSGTGGD